MQNHITHQLRYAHARAIQRARTRRLCALCGLTLGALTGATGWGIIAASTEFPITIPLIPIAIWAAWSVRTLARNFSR